MWGTLIGVGMNMLSGITSQQGTDNSSNNQGTDVEKLLELAQLLSGAQKTNTSQGVLA